MTGVVCKICGGDMEELVGGDGAQCSTCGFIIRSDGSEDMTCMCDDISAQFENERREREGVEW